MAFPAAVCAAVCVLGSVLLGAGAPPAPGAPLGPSPRPSAVSSGAVTEAQTTESVRTLDTTGSTLPIDLDATVRPLRTEERHGGRLIVTISADVLFDFDSDDLTDAARAEIARLAPRVPAGTEAVTVLGHTDGLGTPAYNVILSQRRADAVADLLRPVVPNGTRVSATGRGGADPVVPNTRPDGSDDPAGRALNRRVVVSFPAG